MTGAAADTAWEHGSPSRARARWIHGPVADAGLALAWVPFAALAIVLREAPDARNALLAGVFALSFVHQPMTLPLVYLDPAERAARRRMIWLVPLVLVAAIAAGLAVSFTLVAIVAAAWNALHTMMQRFGIVRIYGRKAGEVDPARARVERALLLTWLALAATWVGADRATPARLRSLDLGAVNRRGIEVLSDLRPYATALVVPLAVAVAMLTTRWVRVERCARHEGLANPAKHLYVGSTVALLALVVVDPVAALVGFVASHSVEYLVLVHHALGSRYRNDGAGGALGRAVRRGDHGPLRVLVTCGALTLALVVALRTHGGPWGYTWALLLFGGMHFVFDAVIWKLRRPAVARSFEA
jgi:hypothetical protein